MGDPRQQQLSPSTPNVLLGYHCELGSSGGDITPNDFVCCFHPILWHLHAEMSILLPNDQRQHRTLHIQKDVPPYALC